MNTVLKITQEHLDAASEQMSGYELMLDFVNKVIELANAEQQESKGSAWYTPTSFIDKQKLRESQQESEYITAAQARELGVGNAEYQSSAGVWEKLDHDFYTHASVCDDSLKYRAIKQAQPVSWDTKYIDSTPKLSVGNSAFEDWFQAQEFVTLAGVKQMCRDSYAAGMGDPLVTYATTQTQPEPVDPHAALRAEYIRQRDAVPCELEFYKWEFNYENRGWESVGLNTPIFDNQHKYHCTDISCYVSKDGDTAIRMLRTKAQELQRKLGDTVDWFMPEPNKVGAGLKIAFTLQGPYTYRTKATIKLDGNMVTPEQAAAEWDAKKETHDLWCFSEFTEPSIQGGNVFYLFKREEKFEYELRPKPAKVVVCTGSRADVIALLKEMELL